MLGFIVFFRGWTLLLYNRAASSLLEYFTSHSVHCIVHTTHTFDYIQYSMYCITSMENTIRSVLIPRFIFIRIHRWLMYSSYGKLLLSSVNIFVDKDGSEFFIRIRQSIRILLIRIRSIICTLFASLSLGFLYSKLHLIPKYKHMVVQCEVTGLNLSSPFLSSSPLIAPLAVYSRGGWTWETPKS